MPGWDAIGAPLDSSGEREGEERAPAALRAAALISELGADDRGDIGARITSSERDPDTGVIGYPDVLAASRELRTEVAASCRMGRRPLVLGGDCTLLIGALAGAQMDATALGLVMLDGHLDAYDGRTSPSGECADMDFAIVLGSGPAELTGLGARRPIVPPSDAVAIGYREPDLSTMRPEWEPVGEPELIDPEVEVIAAEQVGSPTDAELGARLERAMRSGPGRFWLHLDADAIDPAEMPAVSYREPGGLSSAQVASLIGPLARSPALCGLSVSDLNSDRDPGGDCARLLAELLIEALS